MRIPPRLYTILGISGGFFIIDRFLKWATLHIWSQPNLVNNYFGWEPFLNPGIAFGIPIPNKIVILITFPILGILLSSAWTQVKKIALQPLSFKDPSFQSLFGFILIFFGALSNLIDRIAIQHTVDYLLIFTGIVNLADALIVAGFALYFYSSLKNKS